MAWQDWFGQGQENHRAPSAIEYACFFDALEDAKQHNRTVAESYEHYGFETDPLKILGRYIEFELQHAWLKASVSSSKILKCSPSFLAHLWCAMVVRHYTILADYAEFSHLALTPEQVPRLFRQVYLFYDFLWGANLLLTRINETGVIGENQTQEYIKAFRIEALETLPQQHLPFACPEGLTIFEHGDENKEDWDFYRHGKLGKPCYEKTSPKSVTTSTYLMIGRHLN